MSIPRIENCCCCSVRVGTLVLLYLGLFGGISAIFSPSSVTYSFKDSHGNTQYYKTAETAKVPSGITALIVSILGLYGVYKEEHLFLVPALIIYVLSLIGIALIGALSFITLLIAGAVGVSLYTLFIFFIVFAIAGYLTDVIYSHYCEIKEKKEGRKSSGVV